jgi:hypothetical protein
MLPLTLLIPAGVALVSVGGALLLNRKAKPVHSIEQDETGLKEAFTRVMNMANPPIEESKKLIAKLKQFDFKEEANQLKSRLELSLLPEEVKEKRQLAVKNALKSTDKGKVLELAESFEKSGAHATAKSLRDYASGL